MAHPVTLEYESVTAEERDKEKAKLRVGTLRYTKAGLLWVFLWLLWGDFVFTLMEAVVPSILPLRLKELNTPDWALPIVLAMLPNTINFIFNPIISTKSDRTRTRMGRRIPFLLIGTPLVTMGLVLLAFSAEIGAALHGWIGPLTGWHVTTVLILTIAFLFVLFKISDMFINTVFWYIFNDVVPGGFMGRFLGLFRTVGSLVGMLYNAFVYQHALSHMRWILLGAAGIYFVGFLMMCLLVKEGRYPRPKAIGKTMLAAMRTYVKECLTHRFYWYLFLQHAFWNMSHAAGVFFVFLKLSLGLSLQQIGTLTALQSMSQMLLNYPAGILADRFHPMRVLVWMKVGLVCIVPLNFVWLFGPFSVRTVFAIFVVLFLVELPLGVLFSAVLQPMQMRVLPKSRYGQFCSFQATATSLCGIGASFVVGFFMMYLRHLFPDATYGKDFCYQLFPLWRLPFLACSLTFLFLLYREWKRLGAEQHYQPPGFVEDHTRPAGGPPAAMGEGKKGP